MDLTISTGARVASSLSDLRLELAASRRRGVVAMRHKAGVACFGHMNSETARAKRTMKKLNVLMIGAAILLPTMSKAAINKGIEGSPHDFSGTNYVWNS